jgi:hypothetical protein
MKRLVVVTALVSLYAGTLAAQSSGLRVYDSTGRVVGDYLPSLPCVNPGGVPCNGLAILSTPSGLVVLPVSSGGVYFPPVYQFNKPQFFHTSDDCSGPRFVGTIGDSVDGLFPPPAFKTGSKIVVPMNPLLHLDVHSVETFEGNPGQVDFSQPGVCSLTSQTGAPFYLTVVVDAALFGTPPFSVR